MPGGGARPEPAVRVVEIRGYRVAWRLPTPAGSARGVLHRREALLIEAVGAGGLTGWGETWSAPDAAEELIRKRLAPLLLSAGPAAIGDLWRRMAEATGDCPASLAMPAIAALDIALHDLAARAAGAPVTTLLGGARRDRVLAYASGPFMAEGDDPYAGYVAAAEGYVERGFRAVKPRLGRDPAADGRTGAALRRALGPDIALMADFNQGYAAERAVAAARSLEASDLLWIEEPVKPDDVAGYRAVKAATSAAVAGGEDWAVAGVFKDFLAADAVTVLQPDLAVCGGFTGVLAVADLAAARGLPVAPHVWGTLVSWRASLQLVAVLPAVAAGAGRTYPFVEYEQTGNPLLARHGAPELDADGMVSVGEGPGLGALFDAVELEPWIVGRWRMAP